MDLVKYLSLSYKVLWRESMDSCKIPLGESRWILALGCKFVTLKDKTMKKAISFLWTPFLSQPIGKAFIH